jgi:voltage-gated potassium channel
MARARGLSNPDRRTPIAVAAVRRLYASSRFKFALIAFDIMVVVSFLVLTFVPRESWVPILEVAIGLLLLAELTGRLIAAERRIRCLARVTSLLDMVIIASLFVPTLTGSFAFLRVVRAVRLFHTLDLAHELRGRSAWFASNEEVVRSVTHILIFLLVTSAIVYEAQVDINSDINTFSDALYFTVTTVTTTGFGDITLRGETGRLISMAIMITGITLFVRLAQSILRPSKVHHLCDRCGLSRHDPDAVHCKHCGNYVHIPTEGVG